MVQHMNHFLTSAKSVKHEKNASISNKLFILKIFTFISADELSQCARTDLNKRFLPKPMTTTG